MDGLHTACVVGRYFFLVALILQAIGMVIAVYLRIRRPPNYDEYKEFENDAERQLQLSVQNAVQLEGLSAATKARQGAAPSGPPQLTRATAGSLYAKTSSGRWGLRERVGASGTGGGSGYRAVRGGRGGGR